MIPASVNVVLSKPLALAMPITIRTVIMIFVCPPDSLKFVFLGK